MTSLMDGDSHAPEQGTTVISRNGAQGPLCRALQVALVATQIRIAWHSHQVSSDMAMRTLDATMRDILSIEVVEDEQSGP